MNEEEQRFRGDLDVSDEMKIDFAIEEFYQLTKQYDGESEIIRKIKLQRNIIVNMMDTYIKKYRNRELTEEFHTNLRNAKKEVIKNGIIKKYNLYMREIRVIQDYLKIREHIADKVANDFITNCLRTGEDLGTKRNN